MNGDLKPISDKPSSLMTPDILKQARDNVKQLTQQLEQGPLHAPLAGESAAKDFKSLQSASDQAIKWDVLPDGQEVKVIGDVERLKDYNHKQGDNALGYQGTCGLCSCEGVLKQCGQNVTENDVVTHAAKNGLCETTGVPEQCGGTTIEQQAHILKDYAVPAHAEVSDINTLAQQVEQGKGIIVEANAGVLWNDARYYGTGEFNHAVVVTGVARDAETETIAGFYINDSGTGESGKFIDVETMALAWEQTGGLCVVTDKATTG